jgi:hypothetical protein
LGVEVPQEDKKLGTVKPTAIPAAAFDELPINFLRLGLNEVLLLFDRFIS